MKWFDAHPEVGMLVRAGKFARKVFRRRRARKHKQEELPFEKEHTNVNKILELLAKYRTSTKSGATGLLPFLAVLPFYDQINAYLVKACESEQGPTMFLAGGGVIWVTMYVSARLSKSPEKPGVL